MTLSDTDQENAIELNKVTRNLLLGKLYDMIESLETKITRGRIKDPKNEKIKVDQVRVFGYLCSIYNQVSKDVELDELKAEIEELREMLENAQ